MRLAGRTVLITGAGRGIGRACALRAAAAMNSVVDPRDVADAAVWLASHESRRVTGTVLTVDAGYSAQ